MQCLESLSLMSQNCSYVVFDRTLMYQSGSFSLRVFPLFIFWLLRPFKQQSLLCFEFYLRLNYL